MSPKNRLRLLLLALGRSLLRRRSEPLVLPPGGAVVIAPHPDDEAFGCGSLLAATSHTTEWQVLFLTSGEASHPEHPVLTPADLAGQREQEARLATATLGLPRSALHFLRLPDTRLSRLGAAETATALTAIAGVLADIQAAIVLLPWRHDGSTEHAAANVLVRAALAGLRPTPRVLEYPVWAAWSPRRLLRLACTPGRIHLHAPGDGGAAKRRALAAYLSQLASISPWTKPVLPPDFVAAFAHGREFFLETTP